MKRAILYLTVSITLAACSSVPKFTSVEKESLNLKKKGSADSITYSDPGDSVLATETGIASYYAEPFHGRKTANGEIYNMYDLTAAHPSFPLGSIARVTNLKNGKSVLIKINDRMPKHPDRIIDLSYGVARELDMLKDGLAKVRIDIMKWGDNKYLSPSKSTSN